MFSVQVDKFAGWVGLGDGPIVEVQQTAAVVRQQSPAVSCPLVVGGGQGMHRGVHYLLITE